MNRPPKAIVTKERTHIMYGELWHAAGKMLAFGQLKEPGYSYQFLSSALLTAFAFEAFVNHIGPQIIESWERIDRLPPLAKFALLSELLRVPFVKGERPSQSLEELFEFRNTIAHGRTETWEDAPISRDINDQLDSYLGQRPRRSWQRLIETDDFAVRVRDDVEKIMGALHKAHPDPKEVLFSQGFTLGSAELQSDE